MATIFTARGWSPQMKSPVRIALVFLLVLPAALIATRAVAAEPAMREIEEWRSARAERIRSENGWLTLVGLFWLEPGETRFGTDRSNPIALPDGSGPALGGSFVRDGPTVRLKANPDAGVTVNGGAPTGDALRTDADGKPDEVRSGRVRMTVIRRGEKIGIRAKDPDSPVRKGFRGLEYFPASLDYRVEAEFLPYPEPREVRIPTVLGTVETMTAPGIVKFRIRGKDVSLEPVLEEPGAKELFFIFRDETSGKETYEAGRFLYTELPKDGRVTLDFNRAYNPPCAFTPYATCPLPPRKNRIPLRVEAGEKAYGGHP